MTMQDHWRSLAAVQASGDRWRQDCCLAGIDGPAPAKRLDNWNFSKEFRGHPCLSDVRCPWM